jgi:hypothetical protein
MRSIRSRGTATNRPGDAQLGTRTPAELGIIGAGERPPVVHNTYYAHILQNDG